MIDEPTPFAPRAEWLEHRASMEMIAVEYGLTPELESMIRVADAAIVGLVHGNSMG
jgi:hypothetical protein